jgi:prevent-host-death family protein
MRNGNNDAIAISTLNGRTGLAKLLRRIEEEHRSLVIEERGAPKAVLLTVRDYVRLASPEPAVLKVIGEESRRKRTDKLTPHQIERTIKAARAEKAKRG